MKGPSEALLCAVLALEPSIVHFHGWEKVSSIQFLKEYHALKLYLNKIAPGQEFYVMPRRIHAVPQGYELTALKWRGHRIYRKIQQEAA